MPGYVVFCFFLALGVELSGVFLGCGSSERLAGRITLIEKRMSDLHRSSTKLVERIDEIEIQLGLLSRRINSTHGSGFEKKLSKGARITSLGSGEKRVQKSKKEKTKTKFPPKYLTLMSELDPALVSEKLPPDPKNERLRSLQQADRLSETRDDRAEIEFNKAFLSYQSSRHKEVIAILARWLGHYADHPLIIEARYMLGKSRIALGELEEAQSDLFVLAQQYPKNKKAPEALLTAGRCQEKLGRTRQARSTYLQLVESYPLSREATEANQRLKALR